MRSAVGERTRAARTATVPAQRTVPVTAPGPARTGRPQPERTGVASKAYARRDDRLRRLLGGRPVRTGVPAGRAQFVMLVMVLLAIGLVATLWLSTAASADSYRLRDATVAARELSQRSERLHREVAVLESPAELARRAAELGMVPVQDSARIVVAPDGTVSMVGEPRVAVAPAPPVPPAPPVVPPPVPAPEATPAPEPVPADAATQQPADPAAPADPTAPASGISGADASGVDAIDPDAVPAPAVAGTG